MPTSKQLRSPSISQILEQTYCEQKMVFRQEGLPETLEAHNQRAQAIGNQVHQRYTLSSWLMWLINLFR